MAPSLSEKTSNTVIPSSPPTMPADVEKAAGDANPAPGPPVNDEAELNYQPKTLKFWTVMVSIFLAMFLVALDRTIIGTAVPQITQEFNSLGDIGWYGSAYLLTTAASQLLFGRVYKFYDIKRTFLITVLIFEIGSAICGSAPNSVAFIIGRAIAGLGGAGIFSGCMIIMIPMIPLRKRPMFQGVFGFVFGVASAIGPLLGGAFTDGTTWRWCFYINLPIGVFAVACLILVLHIPREKQKPASIGEHITRLDPLGTFFFVPSIVCLLIALQWGGSTYEWSSWRIILLLVLFGVLFLAFMAVQILKPNTATVPVRVITRRSIFAAMVFMFCIAGSMMLAFFFLPLWFQVVQGVSAVQSGIDTLPLVLSLVAASITSGIITQKSGYYVPAMLTCPSLMAVGMGLMSTFRVGETSAHWIGYQFLAGFGLGFGMQASGLAAQAVLPKPDISTGIAIMFFAQQLGGGIFTSVGQNLLSTYMVSRLAEIPGIDSNRVTSSGVVDLINNVPSEYQPAVREIYNQAISRILLCAMGLALAGLVAAMFMEWKNIKLTGPEAPPVVKAAEEAKGDDSTSTRHIQATPTPKLSQETPSEEPPKTATELTNTSGSKEPSKDQAPETPAKSGCGPDDRQQLPETATLESTAKESDNQSSVATQASSNNPQLVSGQLDKGNVGSKESPQQ